MLLIRLANRFAEYRRRRQTALALAGLGERELLDLGLGRHDLSRPGRFDRRMELRS
jgi:uncharacterized protein YjiS (DUF1127 family)